MGGCSTSEDSEIVTLLGVCGWAGGSAVAGCGLGSARVALDLETGSLGLRGLGVKANGSLDGSDAGIVLAVAPGIALDILTDAFLEQLSSLSNKQRIPAHPLFAFGLTTVGLSRGLLVLGRGILAPDQWTASRHRADRP